MPIIWNIWSYRELMWKRKPATAFSKGKFSIKKQDGIRKKNGHWDEEFLSTNSEFTVYQIYDLEYITLSNLQHLKNVSKEYVNSINRSGTFIFLEFFFFCIQHCLNCETTMLPEWLIAYRCGFGGYHIFAFTHLDVQFRKI